MFGIHYIKFLPSEYVLRYKSGKIVQEGAGLSFFYYAPVTSLVVLPAASAEAPFIFSEVTGDYQSVTVQGQLTYRITDFRRAAQALNYSIHIGSRKYVSEDPQKLPQRLIGTVQVLTNAGMKPDKLIALAFQNLADKADKIGQLNITPDLLQDLMKDKGSGQK